MKKNILLLLMTLACLLAGRAHAQEWDNEPFFYEEGSYFEEDSDWGYGTDFYAKILSGVNFLQNTEMGGNKASYQAGYIVAGSLGYCWCYGLRLEAEYAFRRNTISKIDFFAEGSSKHGHFQSSSYMANLLWDLPLSTWACALWDIQSFIGVGIGYDYQQIRSSNSRVVYDQNWNQFSWQLMAGLAYPLICDTELTLEYKYHQGGCHVYDHTIGVGLVYKFGSFM